MSTRANWHTEALADLDDEPDPFAVPIEEIGRRVDLKDPEAALQLRLHELLQREGVLFERGVTCAIKDRADTCCHACPVSQAHVEAADLGRLCRIGREQETVSTEMAVMRCRAQQSAH